MHLVSLYSLNNKKYTDSQLQRPQCGDFKRLYILYTSTCHFCHQKATFRARVVLILLFYRNIRRQLAGVSPRGPISLGRQPIWLWDAIPPPPPQYVLFFHYHYAKSPHSHFIHLPSTYPSISVILCIVR